MNSWLDTHTHLNMLDIPADQAVKEAMAQGVERFITIGTCSKDHPVVLELAEKFSPYVYCTLGVHPHDAKDFNEATEKFMRDNLNHPRVVAVGEIGLDYYYNNSPHDIQREVFRKQLAIAEEFNLPVEIHTRDAEQNTVDILTEFPKVVGLLHCFTGSQWLADEALKLGFNISISGVVTFNKADELREVVKSLPLDRIHIETDAPFLAPTPLRGKKNVPAFVVHTAKKVAELKGVSTEELAKKTKQNALTLFKKMQW